VQFIPVWGLHYLSVDRFRALQTVKTSSTKFLEN